VNDPIADMLTRIRNAIMAGQSVVAMPSSNLKAEVARILKEEGFVESIEVVREEGKHAHGVLRLRLKYVGERRDRRSVITGLERVSRPGRRIYTRKQDIPWVLSGLGVAILSTPKGVMTGARARQVGVGGELLCKVW
ncbi:MAG: 30S ribosomal protein S8, partial [Anaerolineaceae bacterium]|nr:30S ribosomal protein S8 [Anaerolineaceae bacterium]